MSTQTQNRLCGSRAMGCVGRIAGAALRLSPMTYTIGAYIAAGAQGTASAAFGRVLTMPALYGIVWSLSVSRDPQFP